MKSFQFLLAVCGVAGAAGQLFFNRDRYNVGPDRPLKYGDIEFHFYSSEKPDTYTQLYHKVDEWEVPELFKPEERLHVVIHGFFGSSRSTSVTSIRDALLTIGAANVLVVHWENLAKGPWYDSASQNCGRVAVVLAEAIRKFDEHANATGFPFLIEERTHIIGFSLGSQVAGLTGGHLEGRMARITGLDPAKPIFDQLQADGRLDEGDAQFVMVIHTAAGSLGFKDPVGHADFYPNGGAEQTGCTSSPHRGEVQTGVAVSGQLWADGYVKVNSSSTNSTPSHGYQKKNGTIFLLCNHYRAYEYFVESIHGPRAFPAQKCSSWKSFTSQTCESTATVDMGYATPNNTRGVFYLRTNPKPPFGQGESTFVMPETTTASTTSTTTTSTTTTTEKDLSDRVTMWIKPKNRTAPPSEIPDLAIPEIDNSLTARASVKGSASAPTSSLVTLPLIFLCYKLSFAN